MNAKPIDPLALAERQLRWLWASLGGGRLKYSSSEATPGASGNPYDLAVGVDAWAGGPVVPIRSIGPAHLERVRAHLLALDPHDRYLRFGYAANDEQIRRYVAQLNFERDELFGIFNRKLDLIAMAHLAYSVDPACHSCAEFGVSVSRQARTFRATRSSRRCRTGALAPACTTCPCTATPTGETATS